MPGALDGIKILDLSRHAPGPFCSMMLADLGADVIKVEQAAKPKPGKTNKPDGPRFPGGLVIMEYPPPESPFDPLNRNKRSIAINLKSDEGRQVFYQMVESADVVLEGFRPGVAERLGIHFKRLQEINPRIIYCAVSGYGQDGPYKNLVGHDINYIGQGGVLGFMNPDTYPGNVIGDLAGGGMQAAIGILSAIIARQSTGKGQMVDISMTDGSAALAAQNMAAYFLYNKLPESHERVSMGNAPFYSVFRTKDNKRLSLACSEPPFFANLCKTLGCEQYIEHQYNPDKATEIKNYITRSLLEKTRDEWFDILSRSDIAVGKVLEPEEVANDPQLRHREMIVELSHPEKGTVKQMGIAIKLSDTPGSIRKFAPILGEDTDAILRQLGYTEEKINELHDQGIVVKTDR